MYDGIVMKNKIVYRHLKPNGKVFYVGYGSFKRAYSKHGRNIHWNNIVSKYGYEIEILMTNLCKEDAKELEEFLIKLYGRNDLKTGILCNKTKGGDGGNGIIQHSEETKKKISESNKGKKHSNETKLKLSISHIGNLQTKKSLLKRTITHMNIPKYRGKSNYKGVCWCPKRNKWRANLYYNSKQNHLGYFNSEIEAYNKYLEMLNIKKNELLNS